MHKHTQKFQQQFSVMDDLSVITLSPVNTVFVLTYWNPKRTLMQCGNKMILWNWEFSSKMRVVSHVLNWRVDKFIFCTECNCKKFGQPFGLVSWSALQVPRVPCSWSFIFLCVCIMFLELLYSQYC